MSKYPIWYTPNFPSPPVKPTYTEEEVKLIILGTKAQEKQECINAIQDLIDGENQDDWTITRAVAFHRAIDAIKAKDKL